MDLQRLRVLRAVIEEGTHEAAARRLFVSQPAVSAHIKKLSDELDVPLFETVGRKLEPTEAGEVLYQYACRTLNLVQETEDVMEQFQAGTAGTLRIGAGPAAAYHVVPQVVGRLGAYQSHCPDVTISVTTAAPEHLYDRLDHHELDVALTGTEEEPTPNLCHREVVREEMVVAANPGHPLAQVDDVAPDTLEEHHFVLQQPGSGTREWALQWLRSLGVDPVVCLTLTQLGRVIDTAASFPLLTVIPHNAAAQHFDRGELAVLDAAQEPAYRSIHLMRQQEKVMSPLLAEFEARAAELSERQT